MSSQNYKNTDLLQFDPFYTTETEIKKKPRGNRNVIKKPKITNKQLSQTFPFHPKETRKLTKRRILEIFCHFLTQSQLQEESMHLEYMHKLTMLK